MERWAVSKFICVQKRLTLIFYLQLTGTKERMESKKLILSGKIIIKKRLYASTYKKLNRTQRL